MIVKVDTVEMMSKMEELCSTLLEQPAYQQLRGMIDTFLEDNEAVDQYRSFMNVHRVIQTKEEQGAEITAVEVEQYEQDEAALYSNDKIRQFLYAEREFGNLQSMINQYLTRTIENNRLPDSGEIKSGGCGCGGSCGC